MVSEPESGIPPPSRPSYPHRGLRGPKRFKREPSRTAELDHTSVFWLLGKTRRAWAPGSRTGTRTCRAQDSGPTVTRGGGGPTAQTEAFSALLRRRKRLRTRSPKPLRTVPPRQVTQRHSSLFPRSAPPWERAVALDASRATSLGVSPSFPLHSLHPAPRASSECAAAVGVASMLTAQLHSGPR